MTPSEIGERAEAAVAASLAEAGRHVLLPFGQRRYDLAYEDAGRLVKVQCKSGRELNGAIFFRTSTEIRGIYRDYRRDIDLFGVYCHDRREVYLVPVRDVPRRAAHLRIEAPRNGQVSGIRHAGRYLVREGRLPDALREPSWTSGRTHPASEEPALKYRQLSMFGCRVASTDIDIGDAMATRLRPDLPIACCSPLAAPALEPDAAVATATLFKALGDPQRVHIVNLLTNAGAAVCVCDITEALGLSQSTVSFHLKKLTNAGLLQREQRGTWAYYSIDPQAMSTLRSVVSTKGGNA